MKTTKYGNVKLTRMTAVRLITAYVAPRLKITMDELAPDAVVFRAETGALEIRCENDWFNHNGRIKLTISDPSDGNFIRMYFHPETLNRDFVAEQSDKDDDRREARHAWVQMIGKEMAHKLIDQYWEG